MATSKDILNSFGKEATIVKAVALYLGADVRENQEGQFTHQLALLPSERDPKGGVVSIKHSKKLVLEENAVYYIEAEASSARPDNHFGISIYWLRNPQKLSKVSNFKEVARTNKLKHTNATHSVECLGFGMNVRGFGRLSFRGGSYRVGNQICWISPVWARFRI